MLDATRKAMRIEFELSNDAFEDSWSSACLCKISTARDLTEIGKRFVAAELAGSARVTLVSKFNAFWRRWYNERTPYFHYDVRRCCSLRFPDRHENTQRLSGMIERYAWEAALFLFSPKINKKILSDECLAR